MASERPSAVAGGAPQPVPARARKPSDMFLDAIATPDGTLNARNAFQARRGAAKVLLEFMEIDDTH